MNSIMIQLFTLVLFSMVVIFTEFDISARDKVFTEYDKPTNMKLLRKY